MKKINIYLGFLITAILFSACSGSKKTADLSKDEVGKMVEEAYVHCFPIVENYKAMYFYGVDKTSDKYSPMNSFTHTARFYTPDDIHMVTPNNDTFYSFGFLDLRAEPLIIKVPASNGRYYSLQLCSMTTDNVDYIGSRTTGDQAGTYAIVGPNYKGSLPKDVKQITVPSEFVLAFIRTGVNVDNLVDHKVAAAFQQAFQIGGLSKFYPEYKPLIVEEINFPQYSADALTSVKFFELLNFLLPYIKLTDKEQAIIDKYKVIGVEPGKPYTFLADNPKDKEAVEKGMTEGLAKVDSLTRTVVEVHNGWLCMPFVDQLFGDNYDLRTVVARIGIYANDPKEAHYPMAHVDSKGQPLNGDNVYSLTFPAGQLPPVKFFWSVTMYDSKTQLLVKNPLNRYAIGDRTKGLKYNKDGSLTLYFSNKEPKGGKSNWLPAPSGNINLVMRLYGAKESVQNLTWLPLPIVKQ